MTAILVKMGVRHEIGGSTYGRLPKMYAALHGVADTIDTLKQPPCCPISIAAVYGVAGGRGNLPEYGNGEKILKL